MVRRAALFVVWVLLGGVAAYGFVYAFTGFGIAILAACLFAGLAMPPAGNSRSPEILGLLAGPGVLGYVAAATGGDPALVAYGTPFFVAALAAYLITGRSRCRRAAT
jgi:hypothetical protein